MGHKEIALRPEPDVGCEYCDARELMLHRFRYCALHHEFGMLPMRGNDSDHAHVFVGEWVRALVGGHGENP